MEFPTVGLFLLVLSYCRTFIIRIFIVRTCLIRTFLVAPSQWRKLFNQELFHFFQYRSCSTTLSVGGLRQQFSLPENVEVRSYINEATNFGLPSMTSQILSLFVSDPAIFQGVLLKKLTNLSENFHYFLENIFTYVKLQCGISRAGGREAYSAS